MSNFKNLPVTDALSVQVIPNKDHEFVMNTNEVAHGYGCAPSTIRDSLSRNREEFVEGKHFIRGVGKSDTLGGRQPNQTYWTKRGIVRLGFFLKSERARLFRDWAEELIVTGLSSTIHLREDERELLSLVDRYLLPGDQPIIARDLGVNRKHVSKVKCGHTRSARVLAALVDRAMYNRRTGRQLIIGYPEDMVRTSIAKLRGGLL